MEVLETALEKFHVSSTLYCALCTNHAPWGVALQQMPSVQFHAVRSGLAWIGVNGGARFAVEAGDFVVIPHGHAHDVADGPDTTAICMQEHPAAERCTPWLASFGVEGGARTEMICAGFAFSAGSHPLLSFLPPIIHLRGKDTASLEPILQLAEHEMRSSGPATSAVLGRLAEILMVESVRAYVRTLHPEQSGWLRALNDPQITAALRAIHENPARSWTLASLAARASMSRTSLAMRFRELLGTSVQAYIARVRMVTAAAMIEHPQRPKLARVAAEVGYGSEAAFSRAFLREMGVAPTKLRPPRSRDARH
jgi:AraC-like DNA-binding protein